MKKQLLFIISLLTINSAVFAEYFGAEDLETLSELKTQAPLVYGKNTKIGFELVNKDAKPVWVTVINNGKAVIDKKLVRKETAFSEKDVVQAEININRPTFIAVWYNEPQAVEVKTGWLGLAKPTISPTPDILYEPAKGKTIYIALDKGQVVSQQPPLRGSVKRTDSGLSLENNVENNNITIKK